MVDLLMSWGLSYPLAEFLFEMTLLLTIPFVVGGIGLAVGLLEE